MSISPSATLDRHYRMGDDPSEPTTNGGPVSNGAAVNVTRDSTGVPGASQLIHFQAVNSPVYRTVSGRPDGGTGLGIEFNAGNQQYLRTANLGDPSVSISAIGPNNTLNYDTIFNRGLQFWARPTSTADQTLVMDTNQHGARIEDGRFSMRYAGSDYDSGVAVAPNTWYHLMVVRPFGAANGSRLYINGVAAAVATGGYAVDSSELVVGSNTGGDEFSFLGGTEEFYSGVIDDLKMFVIGQAPASATEAAADYGSFDLGVDNDYVSWRLSGVVGDLTHDGLVNTADRNAFIGGWLAEKSFGGIRVGDLTTYQQGDLNFDGITDIADLAVFQSALSGAGLGTLTAADLGAIPEPSTLILAVGLLAAASASPRRPRKVIS